MALELFWHDVRSAWRDAIRRPAFTALVVLTLALGLGVNSAVFALVDAALIRPLPYKDPERLVYVWQTLPKHNVFEVEATPADYDAWHGLKGLSDLAMISYGSYSLTGGTSDAERVRGARVTASLMPLLGLAPAAGRAFAASEDLDSAPAVVILSDELWRRRYGADASIVGRSIDVDGLPRTVVGIMSRGAVLPDTLGVEDRELWLPMRMTAAERSSASSHNYTVIGRLADGVSLAQASIELDAFTARLAAERRTSTEIGTRLVPLPERTVRAVRPALLVAAVGVALLLLVATANASTLLIARAANRRGELAVRAALGATGGRLLSLSIAEGLLLSGMGAAVGVLLGRLTLRALVSLFADSLPRSLAIDVDGRAALFAGVLAIVIGVVFGLAAAYRPGKRLADSLTGATRSTASSSSNRARNALVVAQIALAVVLLSAAGVMINTVVKLSRVSPGFAADHLLTFKLTLNGSRYESAPARVGAASALLERIGALPGVRSTGIVSVVPFGGQRNADVVHVEGRTQAPGEPALIIDQRDVSPAYFQTMGIGLVSGRLLTNDDNSRSEAVVVINRTMARRRFPNEDPLNHRVSQTGRSGPWLRIVGVVEDVRHLSLTRDPVEEMYHPIAQTAAPTFTIVARTLTEPSALAPSARAAVRAIDPSLPVYELRTMDDRIAASFAQTRATMLLLILTASLAAALSGVAVYGAIWYSVVQRTPEIGIRVALGASRASVFSRVIGRALTLTGAGTAVGTGGGLAAGSLIRSLFTETQPTDAWTFAGVVVGVMALSVLASLIPAIRATRIDPIVALRST